jgi:HAD superfamily hydrolase (TIGR01509 family)
VLFDLGGVLVELGGVAEFGALIGVTHNEDIWSRWLNSPWVRSYERGRCTRDEFAVGMVEEHRLQLSPDEFLGRFRDWPKGLMPGAAELVRGLAHHVTASCLSNTNELHWNEQAGHEVVRGLFDRPFLSHELGLVKPDREVFDHVVNTLHCRPEEVLFLDDNLLNIQGALAAGLDAHRVHGVEDSRRLLDHRGLLG